MTRVFRLLPKRFSATPFDGQGSYLYGGDWSSPGTRIVFTSERLSLAMLEYLAHLGGQDVPPEMMLACAEVPKDVSGTVLEARDLPEDWRHYPAPGALAAHGDGFIRGGKAAVFVVPSALVRGENNWLLTPRTRTSVALGWSRLSRSQLTVACCPDLVRRNETASPLA